MRPGRFSQNLDHKVINCRSNLTNYSVSLGHLGCSGSLANAYSQACARSRTSPVAKINSRPAAQRHVNNHGTENKNGEDIFQQEEEDNKISSEDMGGGGDTTRPRRLLGDENKRNLHRVIFSTPKVGWLAATIVSFSIILFSQFCSPPVSFQTTEVG